jgi:hypothetical protein
MTDNEIRIILTGEKDESDGIEDFETGVAAALLVIGLAVALAWIVKNHRERKELLEITEKAIVQHMARKRTIDPVEEKQHIEERVEEESNKVETQETSTEIEEVEEELDEFELRLRRLGKL